MKDKEKLKRNLKKNVRKEMDIDKEIVRLKEQSYESLQERHGFMTNGAIGGFHAAIDKMYYLFHVQVLLGFLSGIIIGLAYGSWLAIAKDVVQPNQAWLKTLLLGIIFPPAIWLITFLGGALFTSHVVATIPTIKGVVPTKTYFKALGSVYLGNIAGTGFVVLLLGLIGAFNATGENTIIGNALNVADHKLYNVAAAIRANRKITAGDVFLTLMYVFFSGILCNLCVSATLPITYSTRSRETAALVMFFAIFYFATAGYQHSPANSFFFWCYVADAILRGSDTSIILALLFIVLNLIPAALGNWLSGGIILPGILYLTQKPYINLLFDQVKLKQYEEQKAEVGKEIIKDNNELAKEENNSQL